MRNLNLIVIGLGLIFHNLTAQQTLEKLPSAVNSLQYDETTPVLSRGGDQLFFTRTADPDFDPTLIEGGGLITSSIKDALYLDRLSKIYSQIAGKKISNPLTSPYNQDIWYATMSGDTIIEVGHPGYPLNNALPNSLVSTGMTPDEYILINQFYEDGSMYSGFSRVCIQKDMIQTFPLPMYVYEFELSGSDVNMTMTPNGHVVIFSMERSDSQGRNDLFVSFFVRDNVWSAPIHMGDSINSSFQETSPFISPDKRYLYFSSDRPGGIGGNDIYVAERLDYTWLHWSTPVLLSGEVNSIFDDSQPYFDPEANYMYFSSKRDGSSDIFRERLTPRPKLKVPIFVRGKIIDLRTGKPVHSELLWGQSSSKDYLEYFNSYNGDFEVLLTEYEPYKFQPRKPNHSSPQITVDPRWVESQGKDTVDLTLYVVPEQYEEMIPSIAEQRNSVPAVSMQNEKILSAWNEHFSFYNLNFVKGEAIMRASSARALQDLLDILVEHPTMEIKIEGHTDNVGEQDALFNLSLNRAVVIRDYLVDHGIRSDRIKVSGMGDRHPLYDNATEYGREKNRRVEIEIIKE